jgi:hypothetical protein
MTTWDTIFPDLDRTPLRGRLSDFAAAFGQSRTLAEATGAVQEQFSRLRQGEIDELRGGAAGGLVDVVNGVDGHLRDLPPVFGGLEQVFGSHTDRRSELEGAASKALARATTRWAALHSNVQQHADAEGVLATIAGQLTSLRASAEPGVEALIENVESQWEAQRSTVDWWRERADEAEELLAASRQEYLQLREAEAELIATTAHAIRQIDLADLADPTGLGALVDAAVGVLLAAGEMVLDAAAEWALEQLAALMQGLLTVANVVMVEALRNLAIALKVVLYGLVGIVALGVLHLLAGLGLVALVVFAALPPHLKAQVLAQGAALLHKLLAVDHDGDPGGTYDVDYEGLWPGQSGPPGDDEAGRAALLEALGLTADGEVIDDDEFAMVQLDNGKYVLVLPGVTDLTKPRLGLNPYNRTVRDVDQYALPSSTSTGMDDNLYAQMVAEAMHRHGVPPGSEIMIVGHSYGADTALDLAADPRFNGPGAYTVTHVAAAAYHSGPQLRHVPDGTEVLVLQNNKDAAVQVENFGHDPVGAFDSFDDALDRFIDRDPAGGLSELRQTGEHVSGLVGDAAGVRYGGRSPIADTQVPNVSQPAPNQTVSVFDGGSAGAGHAQSNYTDYLESHTSSAVAEFESSVGSFGYGGSGQVLTFDISVP